MKITNKFAVIIKAIFYIAIVVPSAIFVYQFIVKELPPNAFGVPNYEVFEITPQVGDPSLGLLIGYILFAISLLVFVFFFIKQLIDDPKRSVGSLLGFVAVAILFFIAWLVFTDTTTYEKVSESTSRIIGASLGLLYFMGIASVVVIIVTEIWSTFK